MPDGGRSHIMPRRPPWLRRDLARGPACPHRCSPPGAGPVGGEQRRAGAVRPVPAATCSRAPNCRASGPPALTGPGGP